MVKAFALQSADQGSIVLSCIPTTLKMMLTASVVSAGHKMNRVKKELASRVVELLGKALNEICLLYAVRPSSPHVVGTQSDKAHANRA